MRLFTEDMNLKEAVLPIKELICRHKLFEEKLAEFKIRVSMN
jgi:hypothetical protein